MERIVIVGASLAGLRAAETLRREGFTGALHMVGDETRFPYDRPPLSKAVLTADDPDLDRIQLSQPDTLRAVGAHWHLGVAATGLDLDRRSVALADGSSLDYDGLVIATGTRVRRLPGTEGLAGVHGLRTLDDALALRRDLANAERVVVVGAGFIGAEVAASCRARGLDVSMVEADPAPFERILGPAMAAPIVDLHRSHGVDLRTGVGVDSLRGDGTVEAVELADGTTLEADVVVVGIGVIPNTEWLTDSGLEIDNGVVCDATCLAAPGVVAAGDIARWPNPRFGEVMRIEHWDNAVAQAQHAAARLLVGDSAAQEYAPIPWFWTDQYDRKIQLAGRPSPTDDVEIVAGDPATGKFAAVYGRDDRLVAVLAWNSPRSIVTFRQMIEDGRSFTDVVDEAQAAAG